MMHPANEPLCSEYTLNKALGKLGLCWPVPVDRSTSVTCHYKFGAQGGWGPLVSVVHELAHGVEFGAANFHTRFAAGRFDFRIRRVYDGDDAPQYVEVRTQEPALREVRTAAIQWHLLKKITLDEYMADHFSNELLRIVRHLPGGAPPYPDVRAYHEEQKIAYPLDRVIDEANAWLFKMNNPHTTYSPLPPLTI